MDISFLEKVPLFHGLDPKLLEHIHQQTIKKTYQKDTILVQEHEAGETMFMILSGKVKVSNVGPDGKEVILSVLGPGEIFGEMSLLDDEPRSANVTTLDQTEMLQLRRRDFINIFESNAEMLGKLLATLSKRLRHANAQIRSLALLDVLGRIAKLLLDLAQKEGRKLLDGSVVFRRPTHQEIASMVGTSRETVSRMIGELARDGYIKISGKDIIIREDMNKAFP
ncbi:MAG: Crp/Fnr family transcriptional regulator [Acidobacteria bacterium]|nr:Crp/Fnr family transcriptional regulator [Acidobacteriota bacterium]MCB9397333.1 Crp/Fnr family transcriptional regulator [Acidobacteriota bacterium]